jgi:hypothetical protein
MPVRVAVRTVGGKRQRCRGSDRVVEAAWSSREGKRLLPFRLVAQGGKVVVARIGLRACMRGGDKAVVDDVGRVKTQGWGAIGFTPSTLVRRTWQWASWARFSAGLHCSLEPVLSAGLHCA